MGYPISRKASRASGAPAAPPAAPTPSRPDRPFNPPARAFNPPAAAPAAGDDGPGFHDVEADEPLLAAGGNSARASALSAPPPTGLLAGTELEALPEGPLRPVRVRRPGGFEEGGAAPGLLGGAPAAAASRPVPVVRGSTPVTVGEMMRAAAAEESTAPQQPAAAPAAAPAAVAPPPGVVLAEGPVPVQKPARQAADAKQWLAEEGWARGER